MKKRNRIWELDFLRGVSIILLIVDHMMYYISSIPQLFGNYYYHNVPFVKKLVDLSYSYWNSDIRNIGHVVFVTIFLLLVGISCTFSRNNVKRGVKIFLGGMILTIFTSILYALGMDGVLILFGILHLIGIGVLLYALIDKLPFSKFIFLISGVIIVMVGLNFNMYAPPYQPTIYSFVDFLKMLLGLIAVGGDSFGLFFVGIIFIGAFIGKTLYQDKKSLLPKLAGVWNKPVCFCGQNTLWIYFGTPVVVYLLIFIICLSVGYRF